MRRIEAVAHENTGRLPSAMPAKPWHKHLWPWLLMLPPLISVVGGVAVLCIAAATNDGLVADDYYQRGITINERLARERPAAQCAARDLACAAARSQEGR
jgi:hypothetical protein